ncbi:MAG TPA: hypothetical protein VFJ77_08920 [Gaiellaceae bacterium]|nr:hypothetical protein [Gaiellaceae bacterium]
MTVLERLPGIDQTAAGFYAPPDVQVAVGPGHVVELVNVAMKVWSTASSPPAEVDGAALPALFHASGDDLTDPRILFDVPSQRWYASIADVDTGSVLLAVSRGSDPTGDWDVHSYSAAGACPDQPRLGISDAVVVLAADVFTRCEGRGSRALGSQLWVVNKAQLVAGAASPASRSLGPSLRYASVQPVHSLSAAPTQYAVSLDGPGAPSVHLLRVDGVPPAAVALAEIAAPALTPLSQPPRAVEPGGHGGARDIDTNDVRVLDAVWQDGSIWFSSNTGCIPEGDTEIRACGRVVQLSTVADEVDWAQDIASSGSDVFFPTARPDGKGNVVVVYGQSSAALAPIVAVVARTADGTFTAPQTVATSAAPAGSSNDGRWGDYFGAARDPSNRGVVWVAGQTGPAVAGTTDWATTVAAVLTTGADETPPRVAIVPPGVHARPASGRAGKALRLTFVALDGGKAVRSRVTVKRGGRVVFSRTTKARAVLAEHVYGVAWKPAKRLRGSLRFCVRFVSKDGTQSPPSCASLRLR